MRMSNKRRVETPSGFDQLGVKNGIYTHKEYLQCVLDIMPDSLQIDVLCNYDDGYGSTNTYRNIDDESVFRRGNTLFFGDDSE